MLAVSEADVPARAPEPASALPSAEAAVAADAEAVASAAAVAVADVPRPVAYESVLVREQALAEAARLPFGVAHYLGLAARAHPERRR
jgi:hypothetical protein